MVFQGYYHYSYQLATSGQCQCLALCMLGNFFKYLFLSKDATNQCFLPNILLIYNLNVKQLGSQMKPHILQGFIWIQIVCIGHQLSSKFTASGLRVKCQGASIIATLFLQVYLITDLTCVHIEALTFSISKICDDQKTVWVLIAVTCRYIVFCSEAVTVYPTHVIILIFNSHQKSRLARRLEMSIP